MAFVTLGRTVDDHEPPAPTHVETCDRPVHDRPVGPRRVGAPKRKKTAHKPHDGQRPSGVDLGSTADGGEGNILLLKSDSPFGIRNLVLCSRVLRRGRTPTGFGISWC